MKFLGNIFSAVYLFLEEINDGRPGNKGISVIAAIFVLTMLFTFNFLSFFPAGELKEMRWLYYFIVILICSLLTMYFYRKKRYLKIVAQFDEVKNKETYSLITIAYIVLSIAIFSITR